MSSGHLFCADRNGVKKLSVLAQDYPNAPANPSSLAKRDTRGFEIRGGDGNGREKTE